MSIPFRIDPFREPFEREYRRLNRQYIEKRDEASKQELKDFLLKACMHYARKVEIAIQARNNFIG